MKFNYTFYENEMFSLIAEDNPDNYKDPSYAQLKMICPKEPIILEPSGNSSWKTPLELYPEPTAIRIQNDMESTDLVRDILAGDYIMKSLDGEILNAPVEEIER